MEGQLTSRPGIVILATTLSLAALVGPNHALAVNHNDVISDLSGNPAAPTALGTLGVGAHTVTASTGGGDFDLMTINIAASTQLSSITLDNYALGNLSFVGLQTGTTWTEGLGGAIDPANLLGWTHFGGIVVGTDILDDIGVGALSVGFVPPLHANDYTFLLQDTGGVVNYTMTFTVVPEPSSLLLAAVGCAGVIVLVWRRRRRHQRVHA